MNECEQFPEGSRKRAICEGMVDLSLEKINAYRERWGLVPLDEKPKGAGEASGSSTAKPCNGNARPRRRRKRKRTTNPTRPQSSSVRRKLGEATVTALDEIGVPVEWVKSLFGKRLGCGGTRRTIKRLQVWAGQYRVGEYSSKGEAAESLMKLME